MKIYKGKLQFMRSTKAMIVYGNEILKAQYLPKSMFDSRGPNDYPDALEFHISLPDENPEGFSKVQKLRTKSG